MAHRNRCAQRWSAPFSEKSLSSPNTQILEARAGGADAILADCAILETAQMEDLRAPRRRTGDDALVEVYAEEETRARPRGRNPAYSA